MTSSNIEIDITLQDERWDNAISNVDSLICNTVSTALQDRIDGFETVEVSVVLVDDPFIQELNKKYRSKDKPTNVLSFPATESEGLKTPTTPFCALGDIIISFDTISSEAKEQNKEISDHFMHMLVHGCLHLLHHDHQDDAEAEAMEKLEIEILEQLGVKNPYES